MKILKIVFMQGVDLILGTLGIIFVVLWLIDQQKNYTGFIALMVGYVIFNIINKVRMVQRMEKDKP
jgi:uncharacterized membrane protein YqjE